jgi:RNA repair pathway DNA polymerase beta family
VEGEKNSRNVLRYEQAKTIQSSHYIGFGKPKQTIVVQATSVSAAGDIFKAMMPTAKNWNAIFARKGLECGRRRCQFSQNPKMAHQPDNIPAGTQVVSSVPIRGTNDALVHPRGAVGIITRTPTGEENHYLVRFPDGFVNPLTREEFDILKHFKDRVPGVASTPTDSPEFDLDQFVIYRCVTGSRAYGLENVDSDTDLRGVYLAPAELQWSLFGAPDQFEDSAGQMGRVGTTEVPRPGTQGKSEHPGMSLLSARGQGYPARGRASGYA